MQTFKSGIKKLTVHPSSPSNPPPRGSDPHARNNEINGIIDAGDVVRGHGDRKAIRCRRRQIAKYARHRVGGQTSSSLASSSGRSLTAGHVLPQNISPRGALCPDVGAVPYLHRQSTALTEIAVLA
ncbi:hypothetical protein EVAR_15787_1 [Eumeta japonica]|uniref:Uncharacterized protein n=1 Tax=Eumeta variegata TaxID=151549 RepID=A0A4C1TZG4_EUMVA|nr:hypothetical protein EVAR_15787_1 [Eumeta japonica]